MKDLLYLKDDQIKDFIEQIFYAYRETSADPKKILSSNSFGSAHLRALNLIERKPGTNLGELIFDLKVTYWPDLNEKSLLRFIGTSKEIETALVVSALILEIFKEWNFCNIY